MIRFACLLCLGALGAFWGGADARALTLSDGAFVQVPMPTASFWEARAIYTARGGQLVDCSAPQLCKDLDASAEWVRVPSRQRIEAFLEAQVAPLVARTAANARIFVDEDGQMAFDGAAINGQQLQLPLAVAAVEAAMQAGADRVRLPLEVSKAQVQVDIPELAKAGVSTLVAFGETDFSGSSANRVRNIEVARARFNGVMIPPGGEFSFNRALGAVTPAAGYLRENVIVGPELRKEYGGGICQVSSTLFRAALVGALPITQRYAHSFNISFYSPAGTDATVYPGIKDFRFTNPSEAPLVLQTSVDSERRLLRFHVYGAPDAAAQVALLPSAKTNLRSVPAAKKIVSAELPFGTVERISSPVQGFDINWHRIIWEEEMAGSSAPRADNFYSEYGARGLVERVGDVPEPPPTRVRPEVLWAQ